MVSLFLYQQLAMVGRKDIIDTSVFHEMKLVWICVNLRNIEMIKVTTYKHEILLHEFGDLGSYKILHS